ncbi:hypothetical protein OpiT1DRAFT_03873 [Opitutaceae bacterium TAV1]|nr:hypothetical protein OpiT1DRAFT_03873 [Opitutaceae bacterium TAV1]
MKMSELIQHIGDENIQCQTLLRSLINVSLQKDIGRITFFTEQSKASQLARAAYTDTKPDMIGIVIWFPRNRLPESMQ